MILVKNTVQLRHRRRLTKWFCWTGSLFPGKSGDTSSQVHCQLRHLPQVTSCDLHLCPPTVTATLLVLDTHRPRSQVLQETPSYPPSSPGRDRAHTLSGSPTSSQGAGSQAPGVWAVSPLPRGPCVLCPMKPSEPLSLLALSTLASSPAVKAHRGFQV